MPATLASGGTLIASTTNDIGFDTVVLAVNGCTINPAIGGGTAANKQLGEMPVAPGTERVTLSGTTAAIPDGLLFTCTLHVAAGAMLGATGVANSASASDPGGLPVTLGGAAGQVVVTACAGDCNGNGTVTIGEVTKCVNLFLGQPLCNPASPAASCPVADANNNGTVSIGEVTQCVNRFLNGC